MENVTSLNVTLFNLTFSQFFNATLLKHSFVWTVSLVTAYSVIFLVGFVGNITVILVILKCPHMRTVTNLFILNLAVADLFVVLFCVPGTLVANIYKPWMFEEKICKLMPFTQGVSVCASVYSLVAISVDRCRALYRPIGQAHGFSKRQAKFIIFCIWTISVLLTVPWLIVFQVAPSNKDGYPYCQEIWPDPVYTKFYFVAVHLIICFCLPLLIISILNAVISWNMKKFERHSLENQLPLRYNINGITKLLGIITVTFIVSWLPLYVLITKLKLFPSIPTAKEETHLDDSEKLLSEKVNYVRIFIPVAQLMGSFNSCVNPVLYAFHNSKFRDCVVFYFRRIWWRWRY